MPSLKGPLIAVFLMPLLSFAMYQSALEIARGETHEFHGKNSAIKSLVYWLGGVLGPTGSIIVGALISLGALAWLIRSIQQRKQTT